MSPVFRTLVVVLLSTTLASCTFFSSDASPEENTIIPDVDPLADAPLILAIGDSLTEGYQLPREESYPALLQEKLLDEGYEYRVVNAGVSGETSFGTRSRVEWLATQEPDLVIIETGANDALRGLELAETEENLEFILQYFLDREVEVVFAGMQITENLGKDYVEQYRQMYIDLAQAFDVAFIPFFLEGVAGIAELNLPDAIHPTSEGYALIVENNVWPVLMPLLDRP